MLYEVITFQVLRPFVLGTLQLAAPQDHQLAQRSRGAAFVADRVRELGPGGHQCRVVAELAVEVDRPAPELFEAFRKLGLELGKRHALHGRIREAYEDRLIARTHA